MLEKLQMILNIQNLDVKMIRLLSLKKQRKEQLLQIHSINNDFEKELKNKENDISEITIEAEGLEIKMQELTERSVKLEKQQSSIKKIEEFNALTKEINATEKEKNMLEQTLSNLLDKKTSEEELYTKIETQLKESISSSKELKTEIHSTLSEINEEGAKLLDERKALVAIADSEILPIYEKLLFNKKSEVVVPLEERICGGCHIMLTAQHENLVKRGEKMIYCEHCGRIHYLLEKKEEVAGTKRRRRKKILT